MLNTSQSLSAFLVPTHYIDHDDRDICTLVDMRGWRPLLRQLGVPSGLAYQRLLGPSTKRRQMQGRRIPQSAFVRMTSTRR